MTNKSDSLPIRVVASHQDGEAVFYATEDSLMKQENGSWDVSIIPYRFVASLEYAWERSMPLCLMGLIALAFSVISVLLRMPFLMYTPIIVFMGTIAIELGLFLRKRFVVKARIGGIEVKTWSINNTKTEDAKNFINAVKKKIRKP